MRIGIIGTGKVGGTLGAALADAGHRVKLGSRHPRRSASGLRITDQASALADAEAVLLALPPGDALDDFLAGHAGALAGKLVVDATNRFGGPAANAAAELAAAAPTARYARAFNTLGWENFAEPLFDGAPADLFFSCQPDDRAALEELIGAVGLRPAYVGAGMHDVVDGVTPLWFALVRQNGGDRHLALRVLRG